MRDVLVALDVTDGSEQWRLDFVKELGTPLPDFGFVCSPLVADGSVFVQAGGGVVRVDAARGRIQWRALEDGGGMMDSAFSSPIIATLGDKRQLIVQSRSHLAGLDLESGSTLWSQPVKAFRNMNILTPVVHGDIVFTSTYGGRTIGYRVTRADDAFTVEEAWLHKSQGYMSTPVVIGDHAYHHLRSQRVMCLDLGTGEEAWTSPRSFGKYWSLVAQGDRILALDQKGELFLLRATPDAFELIDSREVSESEAWAHVAVAGGQLFVRSLNALTAWNWSE
jgi:outer membrane protein assembly factor BamB